jgi:hypothetical protein
MTIYCPCGGLSARRSLVLPTVFERSAHPADRLFLLAETKSFIVPFGCVFFPSNINRGQLFHLRTPKDTEERMVAPQLEPASRRACCALDHDVHYRGFWLPRASTAKWRRTASCGFIPTLCGSDVSHCISPQAALVLRKKHGASVTQEHADAGTNTAGRVANPGHDGELESVCCTTTTRARILSRF